MYATADATAYYLKVTDNNNQPIFMMPSFGYQASQFKKFFVSSRLQIQTERQPPTNEEEWLYQGRLAGNKTIDFFYYAASPSVRKRELDPILPLKLWVVRIGFDAEMNIVKTPTLVGTKEANTSAITSAYCSPWKK